MMPSAWLKLLVLEALVIGTAACVIDSDPPRRGYDYPPSSSPAPAPSGSGSAGSSGSGGSGGSGDSGAKSISILVPVDTDRTMDADPGEGVGIFTEYKSGGHWHIWLSCDTNQTQKSCPFDVRVRTEGAKFSKVEADHLLDSDSLTTVSDGAEIDMKTTTTSAVAGVYVDTAPGDVIQVTGFVGGVSDPGFFFFVQDGKVNGGYGGKLTNPLRFQGSKP